MINVTDELIEKLEKLAMIKLSENEKEVIKKDLNDLLKYMEMIDEIDTKDVKPLFSPIENILKNIFHEDKAKSNEVLKNIINEFPNKRNDLLKVPGIQG
ncbi:Asp-tRNA(Asn)/Glu-tRNA(Gln) amidotransferase subunit GatC [Marinitoga lauensis]|uniref:Asp-tRNA(Asn)/Glu-tRNA(Gln) amidotransferase subunit GatC n=1 Tax=Marinitoga lauensis TaxID=2201189 RepID=UPI0010132BBF|nr:Asp-tRNA(Asn)/Glu-tRNA(Gln) amidotransferase subunit GatC [Marinitoga lauensis]